MTPSFLLDDAADRGENVLHRLVDAERRLMGLPPFQAATPRGVK